MNFLSMKYFTAVARIRSFTRAAAELHITQQTLSAHIAGVEKELGCPLIIRHVPLELTYAGEVFLRYASDLQKNYERMTMELSDISENRSGVLKVGVGFTRGRAIMPLLIEEFQKEWPDYEIQLVEVTNEELCQFLAEGDIDLAIATFPNKVPEIEIRPFYREHLVLAVSRRQLQALFPASWEAVISKLRSGDLAPLASFPFVMGKPEDISGGIARDILRRFDIRPRVKARSDNIGTLLALCLRGVGACFCQENFIRMTLPDERLNELEIFSLPEGSSYEIDFGIPKQGYQRKAVAAFMQAALRVIPPAAAKAELEPLIRGGAGRN